MPRPNLGAHFKERQVRPRDIVVYEPRAAGRPTLYTPELAEKILDLVSSGEMLVDICDSPDMPACRTVERWRSDDLHGFRQVYADALRQGCERLVELSLKLAKESIGLPPEGVAAYKLVIESIRWRAARIHRELFGDKVEVSGTVTHRYEGLDHEQLVQLAQKKALEKGWLIVDSTAEEVEG